VADGVHRHLVRVGARNGDVSCETAKPQGSAALQLERLAEVLGVVRASRQGQRTKGENGGGGKLRFHAD
jgi:hypothetical protein